MEAELFEIGTLDTRSLRAENKDSLRTKQQLLWNIYYSV